MSREKYVYFLLSQDPSLYEIFQNVNFFCFLFCSQCMFAAARPSLLKSTNPKLFLHENLQKVIEDLFKNFHVSLGTTISCICLLKRQICIFCLI